MKVQLINPSYQEVYKKVPTVAGINQPMGLAYLAAYMRENGHKVSILDAVALQIPMSELHKHIPKDVDVVGVGAVTPTVKKACDVLQIARNVSPNVKTFLGGDHMTALPFETMKEFPIVDYGVISEGEITTVELLDKLEKRGKKDLSKVNGMIYRDNGQIRMTAPRPLIENLDILPMPAYDLLPMELYRPPAHHSSFQVKGVKLQPFTIFFSLRGCPYRCNFCASKVMWTRKVRYWSVERTLEEIDYLVDKFNIHCLEFNDEIFVINKSRMNPILDGLIKRDYDLHWNCLTRVNHCDRESLEKMKKSGCYFVRFGVESGSQKILDAMEKDQTPAQIKAAFKLIHEVGIPASASFILGYPGETTETFEETIKLAKEINPQLAYFFLAIPIVGTGLYDITVKENLISDPNWDNWVQIAEDPLIRSRELTTDQLQELRKKAYKEFYMRPSYLWKMFIGIKSFEQVKYYARGALGALNLITGKSGEATV